MHDMRRLGARTLKKKELASLLPLATRARHLEARLDLGENEIWELPDGRIIHQFIGGGPANLWNSFEDLERLATEARKDQERVIRSTGQEAPSGQLSELHAALGYFDRNTFNEAAVDRAVTELFRSLDLERSEEPYSDDEVSSLSSRLGRLWPSHGFDDEDLWRTIVYVGEALRVRRSGRWVVLGHEATAAPMVETPEGNLLNPWLGLIDDFDDGGIPDIKERINILLAR